MKRELPGGSEFIPKIEVQPGNALNLSVPFDLPVPATFIFGRLGIIKTDPNELWLILRHRKDWTDQERKQTAASIKEYIVNYRNSRLIIKRLVGEEPQEQTPERSTYPDWAEVIGIVGELADSKYPDLTERTLIGIKENIEQLSDDQVNTVEENLVATFLELP